MKAWVIRHQGPKSQIRLGRGLLLSTKILTTIKIRSSRREPGTCSTAGVGLCFPPWELSDPFPFPSLPHSGENLHTSSSQWRKVDTFLLSLSSSLTIASSQCHPFHPPPLNQHSGQKLPTFSVTPRLMSPRAYLFPDVTP